MKRLNLDLKKIKELYVNQKKSVLEIAKILNVSHSLIHRRLESLGIKRSKKIGLDMNKIKNLYVSKRNTTKEIAKIMGVNHGTISKRLKEMNIKIRNHSEAISLNLDNNKIKELYNKGLSTIKIGKILGVCPITITKRLRKIGIKIREKKLSLDKRKIIDLYIDKKKSIKEIAKILKVSEGPINRILKESKIKIRKTSEDKIINLNLDKIKKLYLVENKIPKKIGKIMGVSTKTIVNRLEKLNIKKRNLSEVKKGIHYSPKTEFKKGQTAGKNNAMKRVEIRIRASAKKQGVSIKEWKNFISFEPYGIEFNKELKEQVRIRDNNTCQECGKHQEKFKHKLSIHHIDYDKRNNSKLNLISLCKKCHMKTNGNRKHWKRYFQMQMFTKEFFNPENLLVFNERTKVLIGVERI